MIKTKYIILTFLKLFAIASAGFLLLFIFIQMLTDIPDAVKHGGRFVLTSYLLQAPLMFVQISPIITFLSSLLLIADMLKHNEVRILEISGILPFRIYQVLLAGGALVCLLIFFVNNRAVPFCLQRLAANSAPQSVSFLSPRVFLHAERFIPPDAMEGIDLSWMRPDGRFVAVKGVRGRYQAGRWEIYDGKMWTFGTAGYVEREELFSVRPVDLPLTPDALARLAVPPERLTFAELRTMVRQLRRLDIVPTIFLVGRQEKIAYPFLNVFIILAGLPFFLWRDKLNRFYIISLSLLFAFVCYVLYSTGIAFARSGRTPVFFGVWMVHLFIFVLAAGFVFRLQIRRKASII